MELVLFLTAVLPAVLNVVQNRTWQNSYMHPRSSRWLTGQLAASAPSVDFKCAVSSTMSARMFSTERYLMWSVVQLSCPNGKDLP